MKPQNQAPRASRWLSRLLDRLIVSIIDRICTSPDLTNQLIEVMAPRMAQRLAIAPTLFGGTWDRVHLGHEVKLANTLCNVSSGTISIGDYSFFGHNVCLLAATHAIDKTFAERQDWPRDGHDIVIGNGVWIASNATIAGPCVIGDHAVIAAGSVVIGGDLEGGWLYGGAPARKLRRLDTVPIGPAKPS
jgi:acetyltransferase-like isoleucine patch superfamily enzyme